MPRTTKTKQLLYLDQIFGSEDELLKKIKEISEKKEVLRMQISSHEGGLLYFLAKSIGASKIVEIGSLYCYSTIYLARAAKKGPVFTCDISKERHETSQKILQNYPEYKKIKWVTGNCLETLPSLEKEGPFDMVFIDADKENYGNYLKWAWRNLRDHGMLVADNTFLFGSVYGEQERQISPKTIEVMRKFNKELAESPFWISTLLPTKEGLTVALKQAS
ncbi:MAG: O-methyltransferase [Bdellovibrionales bacterium]